jgi:two-component system osmolarity sensor histidine kinase EnvZ
MSVIGPGTPSLRRNLAGITARLRAGWLAYMAFNRMLWRQLTQSPVAMALQRSLGAVQRRTVAAWHAYMAFNRALFERTPGARLIAAGYRRFARGLSAVMPKGLYARSLIIIIAPIVLLQAVVAFVFMERHWQTVTVRLSAATTRDIAAIVDILATYPQDPRFDQITRIAAQRLGLSISLLPAGPLPPAAPKPFFSLLDQTLSRQITEQIGRPFWIDTVGRSNLVEIRIQLPDKVLRVFARRSQTYASNSEIFIFWMVGTSLVLMAIAILFLRNQIVPIQRLADAAENFGKGRAVAEFRPRGAREVRRASAAFIEMSERIARQMEQRTAMLAGVSHDLRTILTRFRLQLALLGDSPDAREMQRDVDDMQRMLEGYLAFASGDGGEAAEPTLVPPLLDRIAEESSAGRSHVTVEYDGEPSVILRPMGFRRCIGNLVLNACRHADTVAITAIHADGWLTVTIDDDGPGIPEAEREAVFRPFYRLDEARNLDDSGTGLGLPIARDIARIHGGDIALSTAPLGGLRATVTIPG